MIICQNVGNGSYPFTWDAGKGTIATTASSWNSGSATTVIQWTDELGNNWNAGFGPSSNGIYGFTAPPGAPLTLIVSGTPVNLSATVRQVPA